MMFSAARGLALFMGVFSLLNLLARWRSRGFDANRWWIDFGRIPKWIELPLMGGLMAMLLLWAIWPRMGPVRRGMMVGALVVVGAVALYDVIAYYQLLRGGRIRSSFPMPFSILVVAALAAIAVAVVREPRPLNVFCALAPMLLCAVGFPLAQIACYGATDYRRPADAIVVLGARAYADGTPSEALEDRILTGIQLYEEGLAKRIIFSGGPGDGALSEAQVMRNYAISKGVPESAIVMDERGVTTDATVQNTARILGGRKETVLAVSHGWHLPRIKLRFEREGIRAFTVPADERGQRLRQTPYLIFREVPALWLYWFRAVAGERSQ